MRLHRIALFVGIALLTLLASCATEPALRWAQARDALTSVEVVIIKLDDQHLLSDQQLVDANKVAKVAQASLEVAESQLPEGTKTFEDAMKVVQAALTQFSLEQARLLQATGQGKK